MGAPATGAAGAFGNGAGGTAAGPAGPGVTGNNGVTGVQGFGATSGRGGADAAGAGPLATGPAGTPATTGGPAGAASNLAGGTPPQPPAASQPLNARATAPSSRGMTSVQPNRPAINQAPWRDLSESTAWPDESDTDDLGPSAAVLETDLLPLYRQLSLQAEGLAAFSDPDVVRRLNLTREQRQTLQALQGRLDEQVQALSARSDRNPAAVRQRIEQLQRANMDRARHVLTDDQWRAFAALTGRELTR